MLRDLETKAENLSRFVLSLLIFIAISFGIGQYTGSLVDTYDYPVHSWSWWSVRGLRDVIKERSAVPNTILLGSSLMVVAMAEGDATWSGERLDLTTYRRARYLDALLSERACQPRTSRSLPVRNRDAGSSRLANQLTMNLASPGQVVSDAYLTLKEALNEGLKPQRVVYGIAPRDLIDSTMESPVDTECYRYISRLVPSHEIDPFLNQDLVSSLARKVGKAFPLSGKALDLQLKFFETASAWSDCALRNGLAVKAMPLDKRMLLLSTYEPLDMVPGFIHAEVAKRADIEKQYRDNLDDYVARYRKPKISFYEGQLNCLSRLVDLCEQNDIHLFVVNMPIRRCNVDLLDAKIYAKYIEDVSGVVRAKGAVYRDLCQFDGYEKLDYRDSVHLNGFGGMKFSKQLANVMCGTQSSQ